MNGNLKISTAIIAFVLATLACNPLAAAPTPTATATSTPATPSATPQPTATATPELPPTVEALPPEPQRIEFEAEDGTKLVGYYYPAAVKPAPIVVLMHWAGGDQRDWTNVGMAQWLQNRGGRGGLHALARQGNRFIWPPMSPGLSFAVFTFDFRGFGESGGPKNQFLPTGWLMDAKAAMETAKGLPDVDPARIAAMGASIGADGAVDACAEGCLGALSLSPGSYFNVPYKKAVADVDVLGKPVWCFAALGDRESAPACKSASGDHYRMILYDGKDHGMMLLKPGLDPDIGQTILDFLLLVFGIQT